MLDGRKVKCVMGVVLMLVVVMVVLLSFSLSFGVVGHDEMGQDDYFQHDDV